MQVTGVAWWALLWEYQLLNHDVSASPPGLQRWGDLLCTGEGAGKSLCRSMCSRVIVAVMGHAVS